MHGSLSTGGGLKLSMKGRVAILKEMYKGLVLKAVVLEHTFCTGQSQLDLLDPPQNAP
jgi:hypothetical protein